MAGKGKKMVAKGKSSGPISTSAPRAKGPAGKGGNFRAGVPMRGQVGRLFSTGGSKATRPATQGSSLANMGDGMCSNGLNAPRGYGAPQTRGGSTPLAHTGKKKGSYYPASRVTGPLF